MPGGRGPGRAGQTAHPAAPLRHEECVAYGVEHRVAHARDEQVPAPPPFVTGRALARLMRGALSAIAQRATGAPSEGGSRDLPPHAGWLDHSRAHWRGHALAAALSAPWRL